MDHHPIFDQKPRSLAERLQERMLEAGADSRKALTDAECAEILRLWPNAESAPR